jgi:hypothetical protein
MTKPLVGNADDLITEYWTGKAKEKKENNPTEEFKKYCEELPWMPECKKYDV